MDSEDNLAQLKAENRKLVKDLRALVIEKNLMEHKLYRAFHKLLQTKKRRIRELEREIRKLKGEDEDGDNDEDNHCSTCRCGSSNSRKKRRMDEEEEEVNGQAAEKGGGGDDSDSSDTQDPFAGGYSDETDVDDEPASKSDKKIASPSKTVVVSCHEPSGVNTDRMEIASTSKSVAKASSKPKLIEGTGTSDSDRTVIRDTAAPNTKDKMQKEPEVLRTSEKSSSDDLDLLVEEFCA